MKFSFLILISLLCTQYSFAQHRPLFFSSTQNFHLSSPVTSIFEDETRIYSANNFLIGNNSSTKKTFFCNLEDKMYKRLNVWIKFRAGSDDIYRKMIATPYVAPKKED